MSKTRAFDVEEFEEHASKAVFDSLKDISPEEELEFWRRKTALLREHQQHLFRERSALPGPLSKIPDLPRGA